MNVTFQGLEYTRIPADRSTWGAFLREQEWKAHERRLDGQNALAVGKSGDYYLQATDLHAVVLQEILDWSRRARQLSEALTSLAAQGKTSAEKARRLAAYQPVQDKLKQFSETIYRLAVETFHKTEPPAEPGTGTAPGLRFQGLKYTQVPDDLFAQPDSDRKLDDLWGAVEDKVRQLLARGRNAAAAEYVILAPKQPDEAFSKIREHYIVQATDQHARLIMSARRFHQELYGSQGLIEKIRRLRDLPVAKRLGRESEWLERKPTVMAYNPLWRTLSSFAESIERDLVKALCDAEPPRKK